MGIELSKTAAVHWSDDDMKKALESVRSGGMSINQVGAPQATCFMGFLLGRIDFPQKNHNVLFSNWLGMYRAL